MAQKRTASWIKTIAGAFSAVSLFVLSAGKLLRRKTAARKRTATWIETVAWILSAVFLCAFAAGEVLRQFGVLRSISPGERIGVLILVCAIFYAAGALHIRRTGNSRVMKRLMLLFAFLYLYLLLHFTLVEEAFGRGSYVGEDARARYLELYVNFKPFRSIYEVYVKGFRNGFVNRYYMTLNLLGNICAFMPAAVFLPYFFKSQRHWYCFLPTVVLCVCAVEGLQFWLMVGSCDVDDLILNAAGAFALWWILRIPPIRKLFSRMFGSA